MNQDILRGIDNIGSLLPILNEIENIIPEATIKDLSLEPHRNHVVGISIRIPVAGTRGKTEELQEKGWKKSYGEKLRNKRYEVYYRRTDA